MKRRGLLLSGAATALAAAAPKSTDAASPVPSTGSAPVDQPVPIDQPVPFDRTRLPIAEPTYPHSTVLDARDAKPPPRFDVKAPAAAPNVLLILIDDMGFGQCSAFGGPVAMPTAERIGDEGLRYNQFHTTALCSPTRAALLTGRNHHMCNMGRHHRDRDRLSRQHRSTAE